MKLLIDLTSLYDHISGIERYAMEITLGMIETHPEIDYILVFKNEIYSPFIKRLDALGIDYHEAGNIKVDVIKDKYRNRFIFSQLLLPSYLYKTKADAYSFMAFPEPLLFLNKNMITTVHDMSPWDCAETMKTISKWYFRISWRHSFLFCKRVLTVSKFSASRIFKLTGLRKNKLWLIRDGVSGRRATNADIEYARVKYELPERYIMTLSTIEPRKNMSLLVRAYRELLLEGYSLPELVLIGRQGWKNDDLFEGCSDEVMSHIHLPGYIDNEELTGVYGGAELFVFPSIYEGFGMPPLEAMKAGTVIVSSDAASMPEVMGDCAIYYKNNDLEDLKTKIKKALELDSLTRNEMLIRGFEKADEYKWTTEADKLAKRLLNLFC